ncbi:Mre11/sbcD nuclease, partial [Guillardia theta CCMP2712]
MRIFISTDNHLGHAEDNEMRQDDSFLAMEEVFQRATGCEADFLLLGGDLFDKNKPSRNTMVKSVKMFKKYCLGERPVALQPLALDSIGDKHHGGFVNYEDPCMNVSLPVFIIHGNHDDPAGKGSYSALDVLWNAGLVNYFGKQV